MNESRTRPAVDHIEVEEAETHNLKGVNCSIPHGKITVVTGVSGSGKSSLAFDTVYAEGQRRYVETLSTYARQFLDQMPKPPVRAVRNIPPSLALAQGNSVNNARTSVGSVTEIHDHLQLLFAGAGTMFCKSCGAQVIPYSVAQMIDWLVERANGGRIVVLGTARPSEEESMSVLLRQLAAEGHRRLFVKDHFVNVDDPEVAELIDASALRVVMDRIKVDGSSSRLAEALEAAHNFGEHTVDVLLWDRKTDTEVPERRFYSDYRCSSCGTAHQPPIPALFNPVSTIGACSNCDGYGRTVGIDVNKVVPDPRKSLEDDAIACFSTPKTRRNKGRMLNAAIKAGVPVDLPWRQMTAGDRKKVLEGMPGWHGVYGFFESLESDRYKPHVRIFIARYRGYDACRVCGGSGLSEDARSVVLGGEHLGSILELRIEECADWLAGLELDAELEEAMRPLLSELRHRLGFLDEAGVGYLTLARAARTLSGGEMHRVILATSVGRMLNDTCYVLDEPTAGLHAHDTERLFRVITRLRDVGNTVVIVEHDPDVILAADWVMELGPEAGDRGGELVYAGTVEGLKARTDTATGSMLMRRGIPAVTEFEPHAGWLELNGACVNNLQDVSVRFPKNALSVVTGVSGSGKSTLIHDVLYGKLSERRGQRSSIPLGTVTLTGDEFDEVVLVDQGSIPRSIRSCPLTFSGAYTPVRELFAATDTAKLHGFKAGTFSFNTTGGRCERCEGTGVVTIEMHFMADLQLPCEVCNSKRFKDEVLAVRVMGKSISDVFAMTVDEALAFFAAHDKITRKLEPLASVGLGYVRLGQSTAQLSGGELQRLKLASYVGKSKRARNAKLFLFDEPTVGLHLKDVEKLVGALRELVAAGHTVIVVEHNLDFVAACDWNVDLGPGAGPGGGEVMHMGPVTELPSNLDSLTGIHLSDSLAG